MNETKIIRYKLLENHDELLVDDNFRYHLYRNCEELTSNIEAIFATSYHNNWWKYRDKSGFEHLINDKNIEVTKNIKTMMCNSCNNGYWKYMSKNGSWNIINPDGVNISEKIPYIADCIVYDNGNFDYKEDKTSEWISYIDR